MGKKLLAFLIGVYAGIYTDQHYKLPDVGSPTQIWKKVQEFTEKFKKENPGPSKTD